MDLLAWLLLFCWVGAGWVGLSSGIANDDLPPDWLTYERAGRTLVQQGSPYPTQQEARSQWLRIHQLEEEFGNNGTPTVPAQRIGPYLYPPTLALLLSRVPLPHMLWIAALLLAVLGFTKLWLHATRFPGRWGLWVVGSLCSLLAVAAGNVELLLLAATLGAAWWWWQQRLWVVVAGLIAVTLVVKPFFAMFWISWTLLWLATLDKRPTSTRAGRYLLRVGVVTVLLVALEVLRWEPALRESAFAYFESATAYQWFVLPVAEQSPLSIWNRTLMQALINAGVGVTAAQVGSLLLWGVATLLTAWQLRGRVAPFATVFALSFVLLYMGRPVGWWFVFLEFVVLLAAWPALTARQRAALFLGAFGLTLSRWVALVLTAQGHWLRLMTLQSAEWPWESWLVLPVCWIVILYASSRRGPATQTD